MSNQNVLCQTDTSLFLHSFDDWSNEAIEGTVPFKRNVGVAKFACGLLISVPVCVGWCSHEKLPF